jgi:cytochrome c-type biogenesis protein
VTYGPLLMASPVAIAAGLVSFLRPGCLPLVPGYLAFVTGTAAADADHGKSSASTAVGVRTRNRTVIGTALFVLGVAAVFTSYGLAFGAVGTLLLPGSIANWQTAL